MTATRSYSFLRDRSQRGLWFGKRYCSDGLASAAATTSNICTSTKALIGRGVRSIDLVCINLFRGGAQCRGTNCTFVCSLFVLHIIPTIHNRGHCPWPVEPIIFSFPSPRRIAIPPIHGMEENFSLYLPQNSHYCNESSRASQCPTSSRFDVPEYYFYDDSISSAPTSRTSTSTDAWGDLPPFQSASFRPKASYKITDFIIHQTLGTGSFGRVHLGGS